MLGIEVWENRINHAIEEHASWMSIEDKEDMKQDCYVELHKNRELAKRFGEEKATYGYGIIRRTILNHVRRIKKETGLYYEIHCPNCDVSYSRKPLKKCKSCESDQVICLEVWPETEEHVIDPPVVEFEMLNHLEGLQRYVIYARYWEGKTQEEVAKELGISQPAVTQAENRAFRKLEKKLERR